MNRIAMFSAAAVLGLAGAANAGSITYDAPYTINPIGGAAAPVLPYYSGPDVLTGVTIWFDGAATGKFTFVVGSVGTDTANSTLAASLQATYTPTGTNLFDSDTTGLLAPALNAGESNDVGGVTGTYNYPALLLGDGPDAELVAPYIGVGNFVVNLTSVGGWTFQVNGSGEQGLATVLFNSQLDGKVYVKYDFEEIPEPASLGLMAIGGLMMIRRRRDR